MREIVPDPIGYGANAARAHIVVACLLSKWQKAKGTGLTAIYFDKLAELTARVWNNSQARDEKRILWRFPYLSFPGIHGPGRATHMKRQKDEEDSCGRDPGDPRHYGLAYFGEIVTWMDNRVPGAHLFDADRETWDPACAFSGGLSKIEWDQLFADPKNEDVLKSFERDALDRWGTAIVCISDEQLRSLGTHRTNDQTISAIAFNYRHWRKEWTDAVSLVETSKRPRCSDVGRRMRIIADEIARKSHRNRADYDAGRIQVGHQLGAGLLRDAFYDEQHEGKDIWTGDDIDLWCRASPVIMWLSEYISGILELPVFGPTASPEVAERGVAACEALQTRFGKLTLLPPTAAMAEDRAGTAEVLKSLLAGLEKGLEKTGHLNEWLKD